ncbi:MAG: M56 family metallopeptidase [Candidatus Solibacter usitatus]|nr:M56 family metallopeptidase [Candidatus Solibacter usitatus]
MMETLGWTLIHFLWQGALIGVAYGLADFACRRSAAEIRYALACAAMVLMAASPCLMFGFLGAHPAELAVAIARPAQLTSAGVSVPAPRAGGASVKWVVGLWCLGVAALSLWSAAGWVMAQRLKWKSRKLAPEIWRQKLAGLAARLGVTRAVRLCESALTGAPAVIGWIRPVILLPASALTGLTAQQIEVLLAHELAHIRRCDYLVNLLQTVVETLLFYHPAVWWIGRRIRAEREHCCDDLAVSVCGDAVVYARALTDLESLRTGATEFAMAAGGGSLSGRVRRLVGRPEERGVPSWFNVMAPVLGLASVFFAGGGAVAPSTKAAEQRPPAETPKGPKGFLAGLREAGYTSLTVDEIIQLKDRGLTPEYLKGMREAGLGALRPELLMKLRDHGVSPQYAAKALAAGIVGLEPEQLILLQQHGVDPEDVRRIHALGIGPLTARQAVELRQQGVTHSSIDNAQKQGFGKLSLPQIVKLRRAGVI